MREIQFRSSFKKTYFLLLTTLPPLCTPSSIDLINLASSLGLRFTASEEAITMLLLKPMGLKNFL